MQRLTKTKSLSIFGMCHRVKDREGVSGGCAMLRHMYFTTMVVVTVYYIYYER